MHHYERTDASAAAPPIKNPHIARKVAITAGLSIALVIALYTLRHFWPKRLTTKLAPGHLLLLILPFIGTIIFGIIDASSLFVFEDDFLTYVQKLLGGNVVVANLVLGAISAFFALFIGRNIQELVEKIVSHPLEPSPLQDGVGILMGTGLVIGVYYLIKLA